MGFYVAGQHIEDWEDDWDVTVPIERLLPELRAHGIAPGSEEEIEFFAKFGTGPSYEAQKVLDWLGY